MNDDAFTLIVREYIDFVNLQVGAYVEGSSGFAKNKIVCERQVHRISRAHGMKVDEAGNKLISSLSSAHLLLVTACLRKRSLDVADSYGLTAWCAQALAERVQIEIRKALRKVCIQFCSYRKRQLQPITTNPCKGNDFR